MGIVAIILMIYSNFAEEVEKKSQFSGIVNSVTFNEKGTPTVNIKGEQYVVGFAGHDFKQLIEAGDSLIKVKNSNTYKLIKNKTGKLIISD